MQELETPPVVREPATIRVAKAKRMGRRLSKLAQASPAIVRSVDEQTAHCRYCATRIPELTAMRKQCDRSTDAGKALSAQYTAELRDLSVPMFTIRMPVGDNESYTVHVSANILSDYKREGMTVEVLAMPVLQRSRFYGVRKADVDMGYIADYHDARANDHAMGKAQTAWRLAHCEGDVDAERAAYYWLYHGSFTQSCKDIACFVCVSLNQHKRNMQRAETLKLVFRYLGLECEDHSHFHGSRFGHKVKQPDEETLRLSFSGGFKRAE